MKISAFSKSYGSRTVLHVPDLELPDGRITAVIGPNGSGKSTLAKILAGIECSDQKRSPGLQIDSLSRHSAKRLSGGETARMALARLLMRDYKLLILDEPTASMDVESTLAAERLLSDYCRDTGAGILLVTHSLQQARRIAQHVLFLHQGELREQGEASRLLSSPETEELRRFLEFYGI